MSEQVITKVLASLRRGVRAGRQRPHKPVMWLAVLNLMDQGIIQENQIFFNTDLQREFKNVFQDFALFDDLSQPAPPFFHLRSSDIWHHKIKSNQEDYYNSLTTSGGGNKRVEHSIEYAYLDGPIYEALTRPTTREQLRNALLTLLHDESRGEVVTKRIGTLFHESFALSCPGIAAVFRQAGRLSGLKELIERLHEEEYLGKNWAKAVPAYARGCGFLEFGSTELTPLGEVVRAHDPSLLLPATQWLMHYHLSAPYGPGPRFWHELVQQFPEWPQPFTKAQVAAQIMQSTRGESGEEHKERSVASTATVFLGSYTKSDALGPLGIVTEESGRYAVQTPDTPPLGVLAYALSHYWHGLLAGRKTWDMDKLSEPGGFGSVFLLGEFSVNRALRQMARQGLLELWMAAPPFQVTCPPLPAQLLEGIYALE